MTFNTLSFGKFIIFYVAIIVTSVDHSGAALRLLSADNSKFDLLLIDNDINDVDIHTFLRLTKNMDLLSIGEL